MSPKMCLFRVYLDHLELSRTTSDTSERVIQKPETMYEMARKILQWN